MTDIFKRLEAVASTSHDPDTQTACIIVASNGNSVSSSNRLPRGVIKTPARVHRPLKYVYIMHAERRAIALAARRGIELRGSTLYLNWFPCVDCAAAMIQAGVRRIVANEAQYRARLGDPRYGFEDAMTMLTEAGVTVNWYVP